MRGKFLNQGSVVSALIGRNYIGWRDRMQILLKQRGCDRTIFDDEVNASNENLAQQLMIQYFDGEQLVYVREATTAEM